MINCILHLAHVAILLRRIAGLACLICGLLFVTACNHLKINSMQDSNATLGYTTQPVAAHHPEKFAFSKIKRARLAQVEAARRANKSTAARFYDVEIVSFDGVKLKATIFQPDLSAHQSAPVVIHGHSFGMFRMSSPRSLYARSIISGQAALAAWHAGYWVVSYDQRGHGESGGQIEGMAPEFEIRDLSVVIDWIEKNLYPISYQGSDPVIGMVGESYAGSLQLLGAVHDHRIDAIVPFTTWYDLRNSLAPNNVTKQGWLAWLKRLTFLANGFSTLPMNPEVYKVYTQAVKGKIVEEDIARWQNRSFKYFCDQKLYGQADVLLIQGFRDVLFPFNEAVQAYDCLQSSGVDVRLLGLQGGHLLPLTQASWRTGYSLESQVHCDDLSIATTDLVLAWFDEKLKHLAHAADKIPGICLTQDVGSGTRFSAVPKGGQSFVLHKLEIRSGMPGRLEKPLKLLDWTLDWPLRWMPKPPSLQVRGGYWRPVFSPLMVADHDQIIAGIPFANLQIAAKNSRQLVFIGLGLQHNQHHYIHVLNDQLIPLRSTQGWQKIEMSGISASIKKGDVLGLVVYAYSAQFANSGLATQVELQGRVELPLQDKSAQREMP